MISAMTGSQRIGLSQNMPPQWALLSHDRKYKGVTLEWHVDLRKFFEHP